MLRSVCFWCVITTCTIIFLPMVVLSLPFNKGGRVIRFYANIWGRLNLFTSGVKLEIRGLDNIIKDKPQILMSNHQGIYDIFALSTMPLSFRWLAKKELFRIPIFGWLMFVAGCVSIDRSDFRRAMNSMNTAQTRIKNGASIMIFPEGTRSFDGTLLPFKKGGFVMALKTKTPIVPITITDSIMVMRRGTMKVSPGNIKIIIDKPIETLNLGYKDRDDLIKRVREVINRNLSENTED